MKFGKRNFLGIIAAVIIIAVDLIFLRQERIFYFILGFSFVIAGLPFILLLVVEGGKEKENSAMFLEFSRNLVESVKAGTPISKSIINLKDKYYGSLTPYIQKLAGQISIGIPVKEALENFARDVNSKVVKRAVTLISEAEKAGGEVEVILEAVAKSVSEIEELKKERQAAIYSLVVEGYIIFFIFVAIMLIMQFKILPITAELNKVGAMGDTSMTGLSGFGRPTAGTQGGDVERPMIYLLVTQGLFIGLIIGKLAEGKFKSGIKHSFIMTALSILIYTGAKAFF